MSFYLSIDWYRIFFHELDLEYIAEIIARCAVMFLVLVFALRIAGKRGIRQLSLFEMAIIICLGSAVGDAMFQTELSILTSSLVCAVLILIYKSTTWLTYRFKTAEKIFEGNPRYLIQDGVFCNPKRNKDFAQDEFFAELRLRNIEHLGQVRLAILETSGEMSVFFFEDSEVKKGLPVIPHLFDQCSEKNSQKDIYACHYCGLTAKLNPGTHQCIHCHKTKWNKAIDTKRIT